MNTISTIPTPYLLHRIYTSTISTYLLCSVDSHVNGDAVPVKEAAPAPAPETVLEEAPPPEAAPAPAAGEEAAADVSVAEKVAALEEKVADGSTVETIAEEKTEALVSKLRGCVAGLVARLLALAAPLTGLVSRALGLVTSLPWAALTLLLTSTLSHLLPCLAWLALTNNPLAYALPVCSLLVPTIVAKVGVFLQQIFLHTQIFSRLTSCRRAWARPCCRQAASA